MVEWLVPGEPGRQLEQLRRELSRGVPQLERADEREQQPRPPACPSSAGSAVAEPDGTDRFPVRHWLTKEKGSGTALVANANAPTAPFDELTTGSHPGHRMIWYRIFAASDDTPAPADIERCLADAGVVCSCVSDDLGSLTLHTGEVVVEVSHYHVRDEGIRAELNSWAAFLETCEHAPCSAALMERTIQARQLFYFEQPSSPIAIAIGRCLAQLADGFYHVEDEGFFAADGTLLVAESCP